MCPVVSLLDFLMLVSTSRQTASVPSIVLMRTARQNNRKTFPSLKKKTTYKGVNYFIWLSKWTKILFTFAAVVYKFFCSRYRKNGLIFLKSL